MKLQEIENQLPPDFANWQDFYNFFVRNKPKELFEPVVFYYYDSKFDQIAQSLQVPVLHSKKTFRISTKFLRSQVGITPFDYWLSCAFSNEANKVQEVVSAMPKTIFEWSKEQRQSVFDALLQKPSPDVAFEKTELKLAKSKGLFLYWLLRQCVERKEEFAPICSLYHEIRFGYIEENVGSFEPPNISYTGCDNIRIMFFEFLGVEFRYYFDLYKTPEEIYVTSINVH